MMRVFVDCNVIISAMMGNEAQSVECQEVMDALINNEFIGITTPVAMANVQYIRGRKWETRRNTPDRSKVVAAMRELLPLFTMVPVTMADFYASMASTFVDLEDGLHTCAVGHASHRVDGIVTHDVADYKGHTPLPLYSTANFVTKHLK